MSGIVWLGPQPNTDPTVLGTDGQPGTARQIVRTSGYGRTWAEFTDLSSMGAQLEADRARQVDLAARVDGQPPEGELGSPYGRYRLFAYYQDGQVFEQGPVETAELETMIGADGHIRSLEQVLTLPLRAAERSLKPGKGDTGELEFVTDALTRPPEMGGMSIPLETVLGQMTSACLFKRAHFEKVWERSESDGRFRYRKLAYRPPSTCYLARDAKTGGFAGFMQWSWRGVEFVKIQIPASKAFVFIHGQHRNPLEGISDLDVAYVAWKSKAKLRFLWYMYCETQATPRMQAEHNQADQEGAKDFAKQVARLKGGGVIGTQPGQKLTVLEANGRGAGEFQQALAYLDSECYQSILAGFLNMTTTGRSGGSGGSSGGQGAQGRGLGAGAMMKAAEQFFLQSRQAVLMEMGAAFTTYAIADLVRFNFGPDAAVPRLEYGDLADSNAGELAVQLLQAIASADTPTPLLPLDFIDQLVVKVAGMLDMNVDEINKQLQEIRTQRGSALTPEDIAVKQGQLTAGQAGMHQTIDGLAQITAGHPGIQQLAANGRG